MSANSRAPVIAIIGRTNVGKSTLFNRLVERQAALTSKEAGTTRDRKDGWCLWRGRVVRVVDTGGLDINPNDEIERNIIEQGELAIKNADVVLFIVDLKTGLLPQEQDLARKLRNAKKPVILVGNKAEGPNSLRIAADPAWRRFGLGAPEPISALRGTGVGDMLDLVWAKLKTVGKDPIELSEVRPTRVAVVGKPNVGKSSILNAIMGENRFIVSAIAHTTREPNDVLVEWGEKDYILVDTAGLLKQAKMERHGKLMATGAEKTERTLRDADVALFVIDATLPIGTQERMIAGMVKGAGLGAIVVVNKWDLVPDKSPSTMTRYRNYLQANLPFLTWAPIMFVSAKTNKRIPNIFETVDLVQMHRFTELPETEVDAFWQAAVRKHLPSRHKGPTPPKIMGMTQTGIAPPTFHLTIKAKREDVLHPSYLRFLENRLRERFELEGTPVVINVKGMQASA